MAKNTIHNITDITDKRKLAHELGSEARVAERKRQTMFDIIHVLVNHHPPILDDEEVVKALVERCDVETEQEALRWLRLYKENQQLESQAKYLEEQARLAGEIDKINKTLARMENRK